MQNTKSSSGASTARASCGEVTELLQVPIALAEIELLAAQGQSGRIVPIIRSLINTTLQDPDAWRKVASYAVSDSPRRS